MKKNSDLLLKYSKAIAVFLLFILSLIIKYVYINQSVNSNSLLKELNIILINLVFIFVFTVVFLKELKTDWAIFKNNIRKSFFVGLKYWLIGFGIMISLNFIANLINPTISQNEEANRFVLGLLPFSTIFSFVIVTPFLEEVVFRLNIKNITKRTWTYLLFSSLLFGLFHMISGINNFIDIIHLLSYSSLAYVFALSYLKTKTIFTSIIFHAIHNMLGILIFLL